MGDDSDGNALDFDCDWRSGFNISPSFKGTVGYLLYFNGCGGLSLSKDIEVWNPFDTANQSSAYRGETIQCIGLMDLFRYGGGGSDPIRIGAYVSKGMAANIRAKLAGPMSNTSVSVKWYIIDFDTARKSWYEASFLTSSSASANINSTGGSLQISIDREATALSETLDIGVYRFEFEVVPAASGSTTINFATGPITKLVKSWSQ